MIADKAKDNILKQIYNISLLDEPINLETIDGIPPSRKLHTIYYNLIWGCELKIPKIDGFKSLLILLEYIYSKFSVDCKIPPHLLSRKNEIFYLLIEQILILSTDKNDNESLKSLSQYFYDPDFLGSFLLILNKLNNALFIKKFAFFSKIIQNVLEDNLELCIIFKKRIINELFNKYDFIKTLMNENQKNTDNEDITSNSCGNNNVDENKKKCIEIIERLKFIFDKFRNSYDNSLKNMAISIDKYSMKRKIDIRADFKLVTKNIKENEALHSKRNKDIKDTLEELKYKLKGYSAKKESIEKIVMLTEENKFNEIKVNLDDNNNNNNNNKIILLDNEKEKIIEIKDAEEEQPQLEKKETGQKSDVILLYDKEKEEKVTGKKRLRERKKKNKDKKEKDIKEENFCEIKNKRINKTVKEKEEKLEMVDSKENIEEIKEEENEKIERGEQDEDKKDNIETEKIIKIGINDKSKKINEYKNNMDNIEVQKPKNQKKEEKNSLINDNKKYEENNHKNPRRRGKISKISINVESLINEKKQKKNDKKKEINSLNEIKSSDSKKELPKSKSPQNKDDAKLFTKKDISKGSNKKKNNRVEDSKKKIINAIKEEVEKREFSKRKEKDKEYEIQRIEEEHKSKNKKEMRLKNNKKNFYDIKLKEEKEDFDAFSSINLRNRVNNIWKNEQKKEILNKTNTIDIRTKSKLLNKDMNKKKNKKGQEIELKNKKNQSKEILFASEIKTYNKKKEKLKKVSETNKINNNLLGKKRNNSAKRINIRNIVTDEKKNEVKKSPPIHRRRK